jgi:hypothetical protein
LDAPVTIATLPASLLMIVSDSRLVALFCSSRFAN